MSRVPPILPSGNDVNSLLFFKWPMEIVDLYLFNLYIRICLPEGKPLVESTPGELIATTTHWWKLRWRKISGAWIVPQVDVQRPADDSFGSQTNSYYGT